MVKSVCTRRPGGGRLIPAVPPLIYRGIDATGTMIVGLPPWRVTEECANCRGWFDSSAFRPLASVCCRCEATEVAGRSDLTASRQAGGDRAVLSRSMGAQKGVSERSLACARFPPTLPDVNPPCKAPQDVPGDKLSSNSVPDDDLQGPRRPRHYSHRQQRTPRKQENDENDPGR